MKKTLILFVLFFSSSVVAENISDFQIEGMSLGDSLLDYMSAKEMEQVNNNKKYYYNTNKFYNSGAWESSYTIYEHVQFNLKDNDKEYIIYGIEGKLLFLTNFEDCKKKQKKIVKEISDLFVNLEKDSGTQNHNYDKSGKSKVTYFDFYFNDGSFISVYCTNWSEEMKFFDNLKVSVISNEFSYYLENEAYK